MVTAKQRVWGRGVRLEMRNIRNGHTPNKNTQKGSFQENARKLSFIYLNKKVDIILTKHDQHQELGKEKTSTSNKPLSEGS